MTARQISGFVEAYFGADKLRGFELATTDGASFHVVKPPPAGGAWHVYEGDTGAAGRAETYRAEDKGRPSPLHRGPFKRRIGSACADLDEAIALVLSGAVHVPETTGHVSTREQVEAIAAAAELDGNRHEGYAAASHADATELEVETTDAEHLSDLAALHHAYASKLRAVVWGPVELAARAAELAAAAAKAKATPSTSRTHPRFSYNDDGLYLRDVELGVDIKASNVLDVCEWLNSLDEQLREMGREVFERITSERDALLAEVREDETRRIELRAELIEAQADRDNARDDRDNARGDRDNARAEVIASRVEHARLTEAIEVMREQRDSTETELVKGRAELAKVRAELARVTATSARAERRTA